MVPNRAASRTMPVLQIQQKIPRDGLVCRKPTKLVNSVLTVKNYEVIAWRIAVQRFWSKNGVLCIPAQEADLQEAVVFLLAIFLIHGLILVGETTPYNKLAPRCHWYRPKNRHMRRQSLKVQVKHPERQFKPILTPSESVLLEWIFSRTLFRWVVD